jgi:hypothetical protein
MGPISVCLTCLLAWLRMVDVLAFLVSARCLRSVKECCPESVTFASILTCVELRHRSNTTRYAMLPPAA